MLPGDENRLYGVARGTALTSVAVWATREAVA
jgi:hypothetical protein